MGFKSSGKRLVGSTACCLLWCAASGAFAADRIIFTATQDAVGPIVTAINSENVRIDISAWYLTEHTISQAIANAYLIRHVPVRLIGDRASIFEIDAHTRDEFLWLAQQGVPIRLRHNPVSYPYIDHWKAGIFKGQNLLEFGSANWTSYELAPFSASNYHDETAFFTNDSTLVNAFLTQFDQMWADTSDFLDWPTSYQAQVGHAWTADYPAAAAMTISTARLEPNNPLPANMHWSQGDEFNNALAAAIVAEASHVDLVIYRLSVDNITNALLSRHQAGATVRLIIEPNEYRNGKWPEFELTAAKEDWLWANGVLMKQRAHQGLTHMKTLVTSTVATNASSNYTAHWQRDHDYFVSAAEKPAIYSALRSRFDAMWNDATGFVAFHPQPPDWADISAPANGTGGLAQSPTFTWNRAKWAVYYDVYLGLSPASLQRVATVDADMSDNPPSVYTWTPTWSLNANATYYWRVVTRTLATARDASLVNSSPTWSFTTGSGGGAGGTQPPPPPLPGPPSGPAPVPTPVPVPTPSPVPQPPIPPGPPPPPVPPEPPTPNPTPDPPAPPPTPPSPTPGPPAQPDPSVGSGLLKAGPFAGADEGNSAAVLQWTAVPGAVYGVCVQRINDGACDGGWWPVQGESIRVAGLSPGTYFWQVIALTPDGELRADDGLWWSFTVGGIDRSRPMRGQPAGGAAKPRARPASSPNLAGHRRGR